MMQWIAEHLLLSKIDEIKQKKNRDELDMVLLVQCQRELEIMQRLKIEGIDLRGSLEMVKTRLQDSSIYFMKKEEYNSIFRKATLFDEIKKIVN